MARITSFVKQVIVFLLVTTLIIRPSFATTNLGGWSLGNPVVNGASAIVEATKNVLINGKNAVKTGTAIIAPNAQEVAKVLGKGVAGVALSVAVEQLLGAVDWVLDPANNQILYRVPVDPNCPAGKSCLFTVSGVSGSFANGASACSAWVASLKLGSGYSASISYKYDNGMSGSPGLCIGNIYKDGQFVQDAVTRVYMTSAPTTNEDQRVPYPLSSIASQVISNAEAKDQDAKVAIASAVADIISQAESDTTKASPIVNQLESTSSTATNETATAESTTTTTTTDTTTNTTTNTTTTNNIALNFPVFCGWAPVVCESAQVVISLPSTISEIWTEVKEEYFNKSEENTDTQLEIPDIPDQSIDSDISFGGSCPAPLSTQINFMGLNKTIEFSFDPVCQIASFIKPVVISISAFSAALIVAGIRTEDD